MTELETLTFAKDSLSCYGLEVCRRTLSKNDDVQFFDYDVNSKRPLLFSLFWSDILFDFVKFRYNSKLKGKRIICGGNNITANPVNALAFGCDAFIGDAENWKQYEDNTHIITDISQKKDISIAEKITSYQYEDNSRLSRPIVEISRGCRGKCLFCQYTWIKPYREVDLLDIEQVIKRARTKQIRVTSADRFAHKDYNGVQSILKKYNKKDASSDLSIKMLLKKPELIHDCGNVRTGLEGVSYRIRKAIGKPITDDDFINFLVHCKKAGKKFAEIYMMYGFPYETEEDYEAFGKLIYECDKALDGGFAMVFHWNAFQPAPLTPLQWASACDNSTSEWANKHIFSQRHNKKCKVSHKPTHSSIGTIIRRVLPNRMSMKDKDLIYTLAFNMSLFKKPNAILSKFKQNNGVDLLGEWPEDKDFPWDNLVNYDKANLFRLYNHFKKSLKNH